MIKIVKVSIIVPVYNSEKYLSRCIESILNQKLEELELILVNDGSTDNSLAICKKFAISDNRIKVIDKPNGGVSSARNDGIDAAIGEYIGFVDSDDWIHPEMYSSMYNNIIETGSDICLCNFIEEYPGKSIPNVININKRILLNEEIFNKLILNMIAPKDLNSKSSSIMGNVWRLLIKKELINNYNLRFTKNIHLMEDLLFCIKAFTYAKQISIDKGCYYYYQFESMSASRSYLPDMYMVQREVYNHIEKILREKNLLKKAEQRLNVRYVNMCLSSVINETHYKNKKNLKQKINTIKNICNDKILNNILIDTSTKGYTLRKKLVFFALKYKLSIYLYIHYKLVFYIVHKIKY